MILVLIGFGIYVGVASILWYYVIKMISKEKELMKKSENNKENI